jgi:hypothetical protein
MIKAAAPRSHPAASRIWRRSVVRHRRDLFTRLALVFMDTTSLYLEGAGGQTLTTARTIAPIFAS